MDTAWNADDLAAAVGLFGVGRTCDFGVLRRSSRNAKTRTSKAIIETVTAIAILTRSFDAEQSYSDAQNSDAAESKNDCAELKYSCAF